jgi:hypothetical protein
MTIRKRDILHAIGCDKLDLIRVVGHGYWYFQYDDEAAKVYETQSVYTVRLNDIKLSDWIAQGKDFIADLRQKGKLK